MKPEKETKLTNALRLLSIPREAIEKAYARVMDPEYIVQIGDCKCSTRTPSQDMPQIQWKFNGVNYQILSHHVVMMYNGKKPAFWYHEASHTCGNRYCLVHTEWELPWENISRDGCHKYHHFESCPHTPPCKPPPGTVTEVKQLIIAHTQDRKRKFEEKIQSDPKRMKKREENAKRYRNNKIKK